MQIKSYGQNFAKRQKSPRGFAFLYRDANIIIIKVVMKVFSDLTTSFLDLSPIPFFWW